MNDKYYTEMNFLHPFMKSNNIKTITEALDEVARANRLPVKSVGLLIEAENTVDANIAKAIESGNCKKKESALAKVSKAVGIADKLKKNGYDVKKKKPTKCPECGQINCSCTSKKENCCKK
jgi:enolase